MIYELRFKISEWLSVVGCWLSGVGDAAIRASFVVRHFSIRKYFGFQSLWVKKLLLLNQTFKRVDVSIEGFASGFGGFVAGIRLFANELFFDHNVVLRFERLRMTCEITVGYAKKFPECGKVGRFVHHKHAHDAQPDPMVKSFVYILDDVFQNSGISGANVQKSKVESRKSKVERGVSITGSLKPQTSD